MNKNSSISSLNRNLPFILLLLMILTVYTIYGFNIIRWRNSPDFGWNTMYESGPNKVALVFGTGAEAGLKVGDIIKAINGHSYSTFDELLLKQIRNGNKGSLNSYTIIRDGTTMEISIRTGQLGISEVFRRSLPLFIIGFIYFFIGAMVYLMKPRATESLIFFLMASFIGMLISISSPSDLMSPILFYDMRLFIETFVTAPIVHLALIFPKRNIIVQKKPLFFIVPYLISLVLFTLLKSTSTAYWNTLPILDLLNLIYLMIGILIFLISVALNFIRGMSLTIRLQSMMIFMGILLGFFIPVTDLISRFIWQVYLFPNPVIGFTMFLILFPLSIGYTIVKHDLFAIDTIVRRTYGYVLSTASIIGVYALIVSILNTAFRSAEVTKSPLFSIIFALAVVFSFNSLHKWIQGIVDRLFYRQKYDYRKTIKTISETMTSLLDPDLICRTLIGSVAREMFLENGAMLLRNPAGDYLIKAAEGGKTEGLETKKLSGDDPLLKVIKEKNDALLKYEIELDPLYEQSRKSLEMSFQSFSSEIMIPMTYKDEMKGIISLGRKKSGKMFTHEDIDLIRTITNQSAIALENARLFLENIEKGRMEEELKIAHDIQMSMLPENAPAIEGFEIAGSSTPAKEVGGDFYDFLEVGDYESSKRLGIVLGDVTGKGVSGALIMAASRSIYRVLAGEHSSVEDLMSVGNRRLNKDIKKGMFVALIYAVLDAAEKTLTLANAGQTQPIMCRDDSSAPIFIDTEGDKFPLGIIKDCQYQETRMILKKGDTVVFYTDGVVEAMNSKGELYGFDRFMNSISEGRGMNASHLLNKLTEDVLRYSDGVEQHDDLTIVVVKCKQ